jgi:hypothetical protein
MPWLRLCHPVANARNRSLLCASGASTTQFRLREARVREPICAEPDSRDLGVADPQRGRRVRLDYVHLVPDRRLPRRMPPVARTARTRGFPEGRRAGFEGAWRWGNRGTLWPAEGACLRARLLGQERQSKPSSDGAGSPGRRERDLTNSGRATRDAAIPDLPLSNGRCSTSRTRGRARRLRTSWSPSGT